MAKSRIGPFALEAPLSKPKQSGQVFRGIHLQQRKLAALRVFPIPMGMTPESRRAYADQLEELKKLRHPGIVRCYGGGFDVRSAFLAYELIDGESLRDLLSRRGRLPWETALEFGQQLSAALEYAHERQWIHGRLSPSKILVTKEQQAKISDFRRAEIASMLTAPPKLQQLQYAAPEVLEGADLSHKADLYSLGAILFEMLTGETPFSASREADLREAICSQSAPNVGAVVLDCPVWFNTVIEQLLSKEPYKRPFSAAALRLAFKEAQRRHSEGVGVLQHVTAGFSPLQLQVDRGEAEKVLGVKKRKKRKRSQSETPLTENSWVLLAGLIAAVSLTVWFLLPLSEQAMRREAEQLLASERWSDWNQARDTYLTGILARFPEGEHVDWARTQIQWVNAREAERRIERDERLGRTDDWTPAQVQYAEARRFERFGDLKTALDRFRAIRSLFRNPSGERSDEDRAIVYLAEEAIQRIREQGLEENAVKRLLQAKLAEADKAYEEARISHAKQIWESIVELYDGNQEAAPLVAEALERLDALSERPSDSTG